MLKPDELLFLQLCLTHLIEQRGSHHLTPRDLIQSPGFPLHPKRAWFLLEKWTGKGWYDYGVAVDLGWFTDEGAEQARKRLLLTVEHEQGKVEL